VPFRRKPAHSASKFARAAKKIRNRIAFDLKLRASFWKGREAEFAANFTEIASVADILIATKKTSNSASHRRPEAEEKEF
jgi:sugar/nucleoside kinase (ribokinase family)